MSSKHLTQSSAFYSQFTVPGAALQLSVLFITSEDWNDRRMVSLVHAISTFIFFPPAETVFIILNLNSFHEGILSTSLLSIGGESFGHSSLYE